MKNRIFNLENLLFVWKYEALRIFLEGTRHFKRILVNEEFPKLILKCVLRNTNVGTCSYMYRFNFCLFICLPGCYRLKSKNYTFSDTSEAIRIISLNFFVWKTIFGLLSKIKKRSRIYGGHLYIMWLAFNIIGTM